MDPTTITIIALVVVVALAIGVVWYQMKSAADAAAAARDPAQQLGSGIGSLVSGIAGLVT